MTALPKSNHLDSFIAAYNYAKRLKTLNSLTPYEFIIKSWADNPDFFFCDPCQLIWDCTASISYTRTAHKKVLYGLLA
jgi:hypothetical protein